MSVCSKVYCPFVCVMTILFVQSSNIALGNCVSYLMSVSYGEMTLLLDLQRLIPVTSSTSCCCNAALHHPTTALVCISCCRINNTVIVRRVNHVRSMIFFRQFVSSLLVQNQNGFGSSVFGQLSARFHVSSLAVCLLCCPVFQQKNALLQVDVGRSLLVICFCPCTRLCSLSWQEPS